ncbi:MAG TPA: DNA polymerase III subunit gamma/tau [Gemmatimonadaceae bacterium]|jgi:DNA polymerase-3 subunit gamma/tau|nr:DNA polymerase III subunit gamma/tau [Gemmatimonadaceae bacterium]
MSLALARKYRPKRFADVAVQSHVATTLKNAIANDRIAHAYLFCGPRGTGKTTLARVLAMALNCENKQPDHEPCGVCASCTRIWAGSASLDVVEIDAASNRGVDDARDLRERAMYAPSGPDRYKVYIIDEAHMLTREAWNALLKILEEPPPRVVFVFATTEPQKIAQAAAPVLSRVQRFDLKRIGPADVRERLGAVLKQEKVKIEPDALGMLARAADGSMRDALSLADQVLSLGTGDITAQRVRDALGLVHEDEYIALLDIIAEHRAGDVFAAVGRLADFGIDFGLLLSGVADTLRAQLAIVLGGSVPDLSDHLREALESRREKFSPGDLLRMLTMLVEIEPHFRRSGQQQLLFETLLVRFALLDRTIGLEEILRGMDGAGSSGGGGTRREAPQVGAPRLASAPHLMSDSKRISEPPAAPRAVAKAPEPRAASKPAVADQPPAGRKKIALDLNRVAEHWDDIAEHVRASGRGMVASALGEATPTAVNAGGVVTISVTSDALADALESGAEAILTALRSIFEGAEKVAVKAMTDGTGAARPRLTAENVIADRVATLRKRDPLLNAAIDALDLRLIE